MSTTLCIIIITIYNIYSLHPIYKHTRIYTYLNDSLDLVHGRGARENRATVEHLTCKHIHTHIKE